jgi:hypothetical protein
VFINGVQYRRLTQRGRLVVSLPPGHYSVRVEKDQFLPPAEQTVDLVLGQEARLDFQLLPVPQTATLAIRGGIPDSEVLLDGRRLGVVQPDGTFTASGIEPGQHTVQIRKERYKTVELAHDFAAGKTVEIPGGLVASVGVLNIRVIPPDVAVKLELRREGETTRRPVTGRPLELTEGLYTVIASAPGYQGTEATVKIIPSQAVTASIEMHAVAAQIVKPKVAFALADWESAGGWTRDGNNLVRRGGEYVLMPAPSGAGVIQFRVELQRGKRLEWVVNFRDQKNHILYRLERRELERVQFVNGRKQGEVKVRHPLNLELPVDLVVNLSNGAVNTSALVGQQQVLLDSFSDSQPPGRFGFRIPGRDQIALSDFRYTTR